MNMQVVKDVLVGVGRGLVVLWTFLLSVPGRIAAWRSMTPQDWAKWKTDTWATIKHEAHHYWVRHGVIGSEQQLGSKGLCLHYSKRTTAQQRCSEVSACFACLLSSRRHVHVHHMTCPACKLGIGRDGRYQECIFQG